MGQQISLRLLKRKPFRVTWYYTELNQRAKRRYMHDPKDKAEQLEVPTYLYDQSNNNAQQYIHVKKPTNERESI